MIKNKDWLMLYSAKNNKQKNIVTSIYTSPMHPEINLSKTEKHSWFTMSFIKNILKGASMKQQNK